MTQSQFGILLLKVPTDHQPVEIVCRSRFRREAAMQKE